MASTLVPAQLSGQEFLSGSHFKISNDDRIIHNAMKTTFHRDFPPPLDNMKPDAARPPKPADFMHRDFEKINMRQSETIRSFPQKKAILDDLPDKYTALYKTHFKMNSDERIDSFQTTHNQFFKPKELFSAVDTSNLGKNLRKSHFPQGDKEKAEHPVSVYKKSFPKHDVPPPDHVSESHRFWTSDTITGDKEWRFQTSHNSAYTGIPTKPATPLPSYGPSAIPQGDPEKVFEEMTTAGHSFRPNVGDFRPITGTDPYTKLYATTFTLKDGHGTYDKYASTAKDSFKPKPLYDSKVKRDKHRNASDIPDGDMDLNRTTKRVNYTTTRHHHKPLRQDRVPPIRGAELRTASNVEFGRKELSSKYYDTTCDATYQPVSVPYMKADSYQKSVVPLKYYENEVSNATTATDYPAYDIFEHGAKRGDPAQLQKTQFDQPLGGDRYFSTTTADHYIPKEIKRIEIDPNRLQRSSLPIGTLGQFIKGSNLGW